MQERPPAANPAQIGTKTPASRGRFASSACGALLKLKARPAR
jgi:hypothetical protein